MPHRYRQPPWKLHCFSTKIGRRRYLGLQALAAADELALDAADIHPIAAGAAGPWQTVHRAFFLKPETSLPPPAPSAAFLLIIFYKFQLRLESHISTAQKVQSLVFVLCVQDSRGPWSARRSLCRADRKSVV